MPDNLWALVKALLPSPVGVAPPMPIGRRTGGWPGLNPNGLIRGCGITRPRW
jgi:hypothetical protein